MKSQILRRHEIITVLTVVTITIRVPDVYCRVTGSYVGVIHVCKRAVAGIQIMFFGIRICSAHRDFGDISQEQHVLNSPIDVLL